MIARPRPRGDRDPSPLGRPDAAAGRRDPAHAPVRRRRVYGVVGTGGVRVPPPRGRRRALHARVGRDVGASRSSRARTSSGCARTRWSRPCGRSRRCVDAAGLDRAARTRSGSRSTEREPDRHLGVGGHRFLVDRTGLLFARPATRRPGDRRPAGHRPTRGRSAARLSSAPSSTRSTSTPRPGSGSLKPADLGSAAAELTSRSTTTARVTSSTSGADSWIAHVRDLHAEPAPADHVPGPGPAAAEHPRRARRGQRRADRARRRREGTFEPKNGRRRAAPSPDLRPRRTAGCRASAGSGSLGRNAPSEGDRPCFSPWQASSWASCWGWSSRSMSASNSPATAQWPSWRRSTRSSERSVPSSTGRTTIASSSVASSRTAWWPCILTFIGDRLGLDLYLVALITFGPRIFNNVALIRRHFL